VRAALNVQVHNAAAFCSMYSRALDLLAHEDREYLVARTGPPSYALEDGAVGIHRAFQSS
jgi:hypothetical protein